LFLFIYLGCCSWFTLCSPLFKKKKCCVHIK
jgi:hypothetical protein